VGSVAKRPNGRWRARYIGPDHRERARHFTTKQDAKTWLAQQVTRLGDGTWIDPLAGRRTFKEHADAWVAGQIHHRPSTTAMTRHRLEKHLLPFFGCRPLTSIQRSDVQSWVTERSQHLAPATVEVCYRLMAQIMLAAVEDRLISHTPCRKIQLPERVDTRIVIPTVEQVRAVIDRAPERGKALVFVAAGTGLRISELAGLTLDRVDFLRRTITVDRQLLGQAGGVPRFGPPKTKASTRVIPVPEELTDAIAAHLTAHPSPDVVFRSAHDWPWTRKSLGAEWAKWCKGEFTFHALRHFYASALISSGESVKVVQERLGHGTAGVTLDVYGHLFPGDEDRTRATISGVLAEISRTQDGLAL